MKDQETTKTLLREELSKEELSQMQRMKKNSERIKKPEDRLVLAIKEKRKASEPNFTILVYHMRNGTATLPFVSQRCAKNVSAELSILLHKHKKALLLLGKVLERRLALVYLAPEKEKELKEKEIRDLSALMGLDRENASSKKLIKELELALKELEVIFSVRMGEVFSTQDEIINKREILKYYKRYFSLKDGILQSILKKRNDAEEFELRKLINKY